MQNNYLEHHGVKGQKWGIRRYMDERGKLTEEGRKRLESYGRIDRGTVKGLYREAARDQKIYSRRHGKRGISGVAAMQANERLKNYDKIIDSKEALSYIRKQNAIRLTTALANGIDSDAARSAGRNLVSGLHSWSKDQFIRKYHTLSADEVRKMIGR